jgi:carboxypeptidase D
MIENGPFQLVNDGDSELGWRIQINSYSWHRIPAWVLYVDQPVGTGFSFTKKGNFCDNDGAVNRDFYEFLQTFLSVYQEYFVRTENGGDGNSAGPVLNREFYFSGESHAGHYIPSMMDYILRMNDIAPQNPARIRIPLSGAAMGNPWTDPWHQYAASDIAYGYGFIDAAQKAHLDELEMVCRHGIDEWMENPSNKQPKHCLSLVDAAVKASNGAKSYNVNYWDVQYPPGKTTAENYFRGKLPGSGDIIAALNLEGYESYFGRFSECSDEPYRALFHQDCLGVVNELVRVLDHPTRPRILFYFGMLDFVCNHVSGEKMLDALPWDRAPSWALSERYVWKINTGNDNEDPAPSGYVKEFENLSLLKIPNAGHVSVL